MAISAGFTGTPSSIARETREEQFGPGALKGQMGADLLQADAKPMPQQAGAAPDAGDQV
ncbi:hypothetical protein [Halomonas ventosae]|uniref:hypothetical protein n=1 Tax=Halomonas ventosae TaxID=229007 RepID=UPI001414DC72|nr:hypothetical protein [Halomonas ventosae]